MKKLYTLLSVFALALSANAQTNLVPNGEFENWDSTTFPTGFSPSPFTANVTQESTIKYAGNYSAKHQTLTSGSVKLQKEVSGIVPGHSYTISYRFLDNDVNARSRMWSFWLDASNATITETNDSDALLRPNTYSEDNAAWAIYSMTIIAPANASVFRFETRTYSQNGAAGNVYYDNFSMIDNTLSVKDNAIAGLKVYPNPVTGGKFFISSDANTEKAVVIFDVLGKQVLNTTATESVNVSNLKGGVYIVKITEEGKTATRKLVIK